MAKKATSADKPKPDTKPAKAKSPQPPQAAPALEQGMASPPLNPPQSGESASAQPPEGSKPSGSLSSPNPQTAGVSAASDVSGSQGSGTTAQQPQGGLASSPEVQPRRPLWPLINSSLADPQAETRGLDGQESLSSAEMEPETHESIDAPNLSLSESPTPPVSTSPPLEIVHPGKFLTGSGAYTGKVKSHHYTPKPPDLGIK